MIKEFLATYRFVLPVVWVFLSIVVGLVIEKFVSQRLRRYVARTNWEGARILMDSLRYTGFLICSILGVYFALQQVKPPAKVMIVIDSSLMVVVIGIATVVLSKLASGLVALANRRSRSGFGSISLFTNLTRAGIIALGSLIALQSLGISVAPILTALGVAGLAVALALQDTLSNLFSGIHILLTGMLKPGDYVMLEGGHEGYVNDITWRMTTIRALNNSLILVPNSKVVTSIVTNYHQPISDVTVRVEVGIAYESDLERAERIAEAVATEIQASVDGAVRDHRPVVRYKQFGDSSILMSIVLQAVEFTDQFRIRHECIKLLHKRFRDEGIEIPFPIRTVRLESTEQK